MQVRPEELYTQDSAFWDNYLKGRPVVPSSLFERIYAYHAGKGCEFGTVHDMGAGMGHFSLQLGKKFNNVIVTDLGPSNIMVAEQRLDPKKDGDKYRFAAASAEDLVTAGIKEGEVDMVFGANMMHYPPLELTMQAVAYQLKPGGTFILTLFGGAQLFDAKLEEIWERIYMSGFQGMIDVTSWEAVARFCAVAQSGYDVIDFDPRVWRDVKRVRINARNNDPKNGLAMTRLMNDKLTWESKVRDGEEYLFEKSDEWYFKKTVPELRENFDTFAFQQKEEYEPMWKEMEAIVGNGKADGIFPVALVMATRK